MAYLNSFKKRINGPMKDIQRMNSPYMRSEWTRVRIMVKARFSKLPDETIDSLRGNLDRLSARLQATYGFEKERADRELADVKASLRL